MASHIYDVTELTSNSQRLEALESIRQKQLNLPETVMRLAAPLLKARSFGFTRDQWVLLLAAVNQFFLGIDTYLVHIANGTVLFREAIPIFFGFAAGAALLVAGIIALRFKNTAAILATVVFILSIIVGLLGGYFHFVRGTLPTAPVGERVTIMLLILAPPILAPLSFAGIGLVGMGAVWDEEPADSGRLRIFDRTIQLPYSKTQAYLLYVALGILVAFISSSLDHSRGSWDSYRVWLPALVGVFAMTVTCGYAFIDKPTVQDTLVYVFAMVMLLIVGVIGLIFHIQADLTANSVIVIERFLKGAPLLAPLFYANMGLFGLVVILDD